MESYFILKLEWFSKTVIMSLSESMLRMTTSENQSDLSVFRVLWQCFYIASQFGK